MNVEQALFLQPGSIVRCPPDRGEPAYSGRVVSVSNTLSKNWLGTEYVWVTVQRGAAGPAYSSTKHVWPSNRLG